MLEILSHGTILINPKFFYLNMYIWGFLSKIKSEIWILLQKNQHNLYCNHLSWKAIIISYTMIIPI